MKEYNFYVGKKDSKLSRHHRIVRESIFNTTVNIENKKMKVIVERKNGEFNRKVNTFTEGEYEFEISKIMSIRYKCGFAIAINIYQILMLITMIVVCGLEIVWIYDLLNYINYGFSISIFELKIFQHLISFGCIWGIIENFVSKCVEIKIKDEDVISSNKKYKKIVFPIYSIFFSPSHFKIRGKIKELVEVLKEINPSIKYKTNYNNDEDRYL